MASLRKLSLFFFLTTLLFAGCDESGGGNGGSAVLPDIKPFAKGDTVSRTLLVYLMAENDLSDFLKSDFDEIKSAACGLTDDVRLFVYFDNSDPGRLPSLLQYHPYEGHLVENVAFAFDSDVCSSDTAALGKVLDAMFADYPTRAFDLVLGSHADGWVRHHAKSALNRTIGVDNGRNDYSYNKTTVIEIEELAALLERLPVKVDRLMFDACLMQGVEVAYALRNAANWIIASAAEIPADGAPYDKMVPLFLDPVSTVEDIMYEYKKSYDNEYYAAVLSAVRTSCMQELADATSVCVEKYFNAETVNNYSSCLAYVPRKAPAYYDFNSVMKKFLEQVDYAVWKTVYDKAVPYAMVSNKRKVYSNVAGGVVINITDDYGAVSAYFPQDKSQNETSNSDFCTTEWYRAAGWDAAGW